VTVDMQKLQEFMGKVVGDMGAAIGAALVTVGDELGLYRELAKGPLGSVELAKNTKTNERYIREWLNAQAASGYIMYDAKTQKYSLTPEQAMALADESSPVFAAGGFQILTAAYKAQARLIENFKSGRGMDWGEHDPCLFKGTERFFRPGYVANLVPNWIPALEGVKAKLEKGGRVADVGCGHGASTLVMAKAFPKTQFFGFDAHEPSIHAARQRAKDAGVTNATFAVAKAADYPAGEGFDLVAHFDCLHDMGDPVGAAKHVKKTLKTDGTWMLVEPFAHDDPEKNHNPVGRVFYGASTMICVPASLAHEGAALGAQAGEKRLREVVTSAGFKRFRRATETPFNMVLEARP